MRDEISFDTIIDNRNTPINIAAGDAYNVFTYNNEFFNFRWRQMKINYIHSTWWASDTVTDLAVGVNTGFGILRIYRTPSVSDYQNPNLLRLPWSELFEYHEPYYAVQPLGSSTSSKVDLAFNFPITGNFLVIETRVHLAAAAANLTSIYFSARFIGSYIPF